MNPHRKIRVSTGMSSGTSRPVQGGLTVAALVFVPLLTVAGSDGLRATLDYGLCLAGVAGALCLRLLPRPDEAADRRTAGSRAPGHPRSGPAGFLRFRRGALVRPGRLERTGPRPTGHAGAPAHPLRAHAPGGALALGHPRPAARGADGSAVRVPATAVRAPVVRAPAPQRRPHRLRPSGRSVGPRAEEGRAVAGTGHSGRVPCRLARRRPVAPAGEPLALTVPRAARAGTPRSAPAGAARAHRTGAPVRDAGPRHAGARVRDALLRDTGIRQHLPHHTPLLRSLPLALRRAPCRTGGRPVHRAAGR